MPVQSVKSRYIICRAVKIYDTGDTPIYKSLLTRVPGTIVPLHIYNDKKIQVKILCR